MKTTVELSVEIFSAHRDVALKKIAKSVCEDRDYISLVSSLDSEKSPSHQRNFALHEISNWHQAVSRNESRGSIALPRDLEIFVRLS